MLHYFSVRSILSLLLLPPTLHLCMYFIENEPGRSQLRASVFHLSFQCRCLGSLWQFTFGGSELVHTLLVTGKGQDVLGNSSKPAVRGVLWSFLYMQSKPYKDL